MARACFGGMLILVIAAWLSACSPIIRAAGRCPSLIVTEPLSSSAPN